MNYERFFKVIAGDPIYIAATTHICDIGATNAVFEYFGRAAHNALTSGIKGILGITEKHYDPVGDLLRKIDRTPEQSEAIRNAKTRFVRALRERTPDLYEHLRKGEHCMSRLVQEIEEAATSEV